MKWSNGYAPVADFYVQRGFAGRTGFGLTPALIVIDVAKAWTSEESTIGNDMTPTIDIIVDLLQTARERKISVFFTTMAYDPDLHEVGHAMLNKLPHLKTSLIRGSDATVLHPRLGRRPDEVVIEKQRASAFFGTNLISHLVARSIDTLLVTGCSTSGCVRATAESSHNYNLHTIVVREAVSDRSDLAHEANLIDIDNRYADVVSSTRVTEYIRSLK